MSARPCYQDVVSTHPKDCRRLTISDAKKLEHCDPVKTSHEGDRCIIRGWQIDVAGARLVVYAYVDSLEDYEHLRKEARQMRGLTVPTSNHHPAEVAGHRME